MKLYINKLEHYIPKGIVPNSHFLELNGLDDEWIYTRTGIKNRSKAEEGENTNTMAVSVVDKAAESVPYPMTDIDLIVSATYTPFDTVVTPAHLIQHRYSISGAKCLSITSACSSFINAVEIVEAYFAIGKATKALVICSEHNSSFANETDPQSGHLWGDGAVAMFISNQDYSGKDPEIVSVYTKGLGDMTHAVEGVHLFPKKEGIMMPMGRDVFINACTYMAQTIKTVLADYGKEITDLDWISPHQANKRIINTIARQNEIPEEKFLTNIEQRGNTGSPSCAICLSENINKVKQGDLVCLTVFGGGYSCGAILIQY